MVGTVGAFVRRDARIAFSYRIPLLLELLGAVLSLVSFRFIAELVGPGGNALASGDYFAFAVVGLALSATLLAAVGGPASAVRQEQVQGTLEAITGEPVPATELAIGLTMYPCFAGLAEGVVLLVVAWAVFGMSLPATAVVTALPALLLSSVAFTALGFAGAAFVLVFQQGASTVRWIVGGLALLSGAYFPIALFPAWLESLAALSPMTAALDAVRGALLEGKSIAEIRGDLAVLVGWTAALIPVAVVVITIALRRARQLGSLCQY